MSARLAFYGPRGAGKSTAAAFMKSQLAEKCVVIESASPLYEMQAHAYRLAGVPLGEGEQDATTLAAAASMLRRLDPDVLAKHVVREVEAREARGELDRLYLCPDSRPRDRGYLEVNGFSFVHFGCHVRTRIERRRGRGDLGALNDDGDLDQYWPGDLRIENEGSLTQLYDGLRQLMEAFW